MPNALIHHERIAKAILMIRGQRVLLDADLASLYGVPTKVLNQAVGRNMERFPSDFLFHLTATEWRNLKSQFVTSSGHGGRRKRPNAFTEQGVVPPPPDGDRSSCPTCLRQSLQLT